jgi:hypothetical protein
MDITWMNVLKLAAPTGLITAVLTQVADVLRELWTKRNREKSEATYLAIRLAIILERFVVECIHRAWYDDSEIAEGCLQLDYDLPKLASFPEDASDWKSFHDRDPELAGKVLSFPNEVMAAEMSCRFEGEREGNRFASANETIVAGMNAWTLAQALRKKFQLDVTPIKHVDFLEAGYKKIQQQRIDWAARPKFVPVPA